MTENDMNLHAIIDRLLDRLERANRMQPPAAELDDWRMDFARWKRGQAVDKNHPDLVAARAEVIALQDAVTEREAQIASLKDREDTLNRRIGKLGEEAAQRIAGLEAEIHKMANILSNLRVWQIGVKRLLRARKVANKYWPKEPEALPPKPEARA